jgi:hypothetical protein
VQAKGRELAEARRRLKVAEYLLALYEFHFPWLAEFRDLEAEIDYVQRSDVPAEGEDPASRFLSKEEWTSLTSADPPAAAASPGSSYPARSFGTASSIVSTRVSHSRSR